MTHMTTTDSPIVTITIPADVRYFRSVRLAIGGLATMVGFDIEAIDDLRIGVDELCAALVEAGDGQDLRLEICAEPGHRLHVEGTVAKGEPGVDEERFKFSQQILSVVADDCDYAMEDGHVRCWLERLLEHDEQRVDAGEP